MYSTLVLTATSILSGIYVLSWNEATWYAIGPPHLSVLYPSRVPGARPPVYTPRKGQCLNCPPPPSSSSLKGCGPTKLPTNGLGPPYSPLPPSLLFSCPLFKDAENGQQQQALVQFLGPIKTKEGESAFSCGICAAVVFL